MIISKKSLIDRRKKLQKLKNVLLKPVQNDFYQKMNDDEIMKEAVEMVKEMRANKKQ